MLSILLIKVFKFSLYCHKYLYLRLNKQSVWWIKALMYQAVAVQMLVNLALTWPTLINTAHVPTRVCLAQLVACELVHHDHVVVVTFSTPSLPPHTHTDPVDDHHTTSQLCSWREMADWAACWFENNHSPCTDCPRSTITSYLQVYTHLRRQIVTAQKGRKKQAHCTCALRPCYIEYYGHHVVLCTKNTIWESSDLNSNCMVSHGASWEPIQRLALSKTTKWETEYEPSKCRSKLSFITCILSV